MNYIIMDLEWNNSFMKSKQKFINEIIEIGAVKLNERLETVDTFSALVRPVVSKKLRSRIKNLTHITNDDVRFAKTFPTVVSNFKAWVGEDCIVMTWGDSDIRTLLTNYNVFLNKKEVDFIESYVDLQKYCQQFIKMDNIQQAGLSYAAECLEIDPEQFPHHRALDDSLLSAECLKKTFNSEKIREMTIRCDRDFYAKLDFKPFVIKDKNNPLIDPAIFNCFCDVCGSRAKTVKDWKFINQSFRGVFKCTECDREFKVTLRIKKFYDRLDIKRNYAEIIKTPAENSVQTTE